MSSVPAYLFMSPMEKRRYFGNISKNYDTSLTKENGTKCSHSRKVKFDLKRNQIKGNYIYLRLNISQEFRKTE